MKAVEIKPKNATSRVGSKSTQSSSSKQKTKRRYLKVITIIAGIITLVDENGNIVFYRQRGISKIDAQTRLVLMNVGFLHRDWSNYKELPSDVSIRYEDEEILGKAKATFPIQEAKAILGIKR